MRNVGLLLRHQPSGGFQGQATDIEIHAREILTLRGRLNQIYVERTGQDIGVIEEAMERDKFLSPDDAREFGLIDEVVTSRPLPDAAAEAAASPSPRPSPRRGEGESRRRLPLLIFSPPACPGSQSGACGRGWGRVSRRAQSSAASYSAPPRSGGRKR